MQTKLPVLGSTDSMMSTKPGWFLMRGTCVVERRFVNSLSLLVGTLQLTMRDTMGLLLSEEEVELPKAACEAAGRNYEPEEDTPVRFSASISTQSGAALRMVQCVPTHRSQLRPCGLTSRAPPVPSRACQHHHVGKTFQNVTRFRELDVGDNRR